MQIIQFQIRDQVITWSCPGRDTIAGSEGLVKARFDFDAEWDDLSITLFFSHDMVMDAVSVVYTGKDVTIPASLLKDGFLRVSAIGLAADGDENLRVTTKYMAKGIRIFRNGPVDGLPELETNPALWEQALALIGPVSKLDTKDKSNLVAAINEVNKKQGGGIDQDAIDAAIEAALTEAKESGEFDGPRGEPGTSVTVASVTESTEDGGVNVVTFSDGNTLNVRNGKEGNFKNTPVNSLVLIDQRTGKRYTVYVDNGKLTMEEVV